jgi:predicted pyridoxine 5'-phosphate oxidase superfamily flavin-nucleotide-binding protein
MSRLDEVLNVFERAQRVLVATASAEGEPHIAVASNFALATEGQVVVTEWFCPTTVANLAENPEIAVVIWDPTADVGYQIVGRLDRLTERAVADGYLPGEEALDIPQVDRDLWIRVEKILSFTEGPHTDRPE